MAFQGDACLIGMPYLFCERLVEIERGNRCKFSGSAFIEADPLRLITGEGSVSMLTG
jgi:hypothetical protein